MVTELKNQCLQSFPIVHGGQIPQMDSGHSCKSDRRFNLFLGTGDPFLKGDLSMQTILFVCHAAPRVGLGHLSRLLAIARKLEGLSNIFIEFLVFGELVNFKGLLDFSPKSVALDSNFCEVVLRCVAASKASVVVYDLAPKEQQSDLNQMLDSLKGQGVKQISIDGFVKFYPQLDFYWIPSFHRPESVSECREGICFHGWDCFLFDRINTVAEWTPANDVLILTGGSDAAGLGDVLPTLLDRDLPMSSIIHWVRGPYAKAPTLPPGARLQWQVYSERSDLSALMAKASYGLSVYGITVFELMRYGVPIVVLSPYGGRDNKELAFLERGRLALTALNAESASTQLATLMSDVKLAQTLSKHTLACEVGGGAKRIADLILKLLMK